MSAGEGGGGRCPGRGQDHERPIRLEAPDAGQRGAEELDDAPGNPLGDVLDAEALSGETGGGGHRGRFALPPGNLLLELDDALTQGVEVAAGRARRLWHGSCRALCGGIALDLDHAAG